MPLTKRILHATISMSAIFALLGIAYSAYKGHADDSDVNAILAAYQSLKNTAEEKLAIFGALKNPGNR